MWSDKQVRHHAKMRWIPFRETHATFGPSAWLSTAGIMAWFLRHLASCGPRGRQGGSREGGKGVNQHVRRLIRLQACSNSVKSGAGRVCMQASGNYWNTGCSHVFASRDSDERQGSRGLVMARRNWCLRQA